MGGGCRKQSLALFLYYGDLLCERRAVIDSSEELFLILAPQRL
jgi:hypothetical protein